MKKSVLSRGLAVFMTAVTVLSYTPAVNSYAIENNVNEAAIEAETGVEDFAEALNADEGASPSENAGPVENEDENIAPSEQPAPTETPASANDEENIDGTEKDEAEDIAEKDAAASPNVSPSSDGLEEAFDIEAEDELDIQEELNDDYEGWTEKKISIPEKVSLTFLDDYDEIDGKRNYIFLEESSSIKYPEDCRITFRLKNDSENVVRVYRVYKDEMSELHKELMEPSDNGNGPEYSIQSYEFANIEILGLQVFTVRFTTIHTGISVEGHDGDDYENNIYKVVETDPLCFSITGSDEGYVYAYSSPSGLEMDALTAKEDFPSEYEIYPTKDLNITVRSVPEPNVLYMINDSGLKTEFVDSRIKEDEYNPGCFSVPYNLNEIAIRVITENGEFPVAVIKTADGEIKRFRMDSDVSSEEDESIHIITMSVDANALCSDNNYLIISTEGESTARTLDVKYANKGFESVVIRDYYGNEIKGTVDEEKSDSDNTVISYDMNYAWKYTISLTAGQDYYVGKVVINQNGTYETNTYNEIMTDIPFTIYMDTDISITPYGQKRVYLFNEKYDESGKLTGTPSDEIITPTSSGQTNAYYNLEGTKSYLLKTEVAGNILKINRIDTAFRGSVRDGWEAESDDKAVDWVRIVVASPNSRYLNKDALAADFASKLPDGDSIPTYYFWRGKTTQQSTVLKFIDDTYVKLYVRAKSVLSEINVNGKGMRDGAIEVNVDTKSYIYVTSRDRQATLDNLGYRFIPDGDNEYTALDGKKYECISVSPRTNKTGATVAYFDVTAGDVVGKTGKIEFYEKNTNEILGEINIKTIATRAGMHQTTAKLVKTDDTTATFEFADIATAVCQKGRQYFKITAVPVSENYPAEKIAASKTFYIELDKVEYPDEATDVEIEKINAAARQTAKIKLVDAEMGEGCECKFKFTIDYIQTKVGVTSDNVEVLGDGSYYRGKNTVEIEGATKAPSFAAKISIKKGSASVYTGQENVLAGTAVFTNTTTCQSVSAEDVTNTDTSLNLEVSVKNDTQIYVSANEDTSLGNHTISVIPAGTKNMYSQPVTFTVNVVKGIESLEVEPVAFTVYKKEGMAASVATNIIYNEGDAAPKTKKVAYKLIDSEGKTILPVADSENISSEYDGKIKISGSKIIIDKSLDISDSNAVVRVKVTAADYAGNDTEAISKPITIKSDFTEIGSLKMLKWDKDTRSYVVISTDEKSATALVDDINDAILVAMKKDSPSLNTYYKSELLSYQIPISEYTLKASNKAISTTDDGSFYKINCSGVAKNIKLTASCKDGGKSTKALTLTSEYYAPSELSAQFSLDDTVLSDVVDDRAISFAGNANTVLTMNVSELSDGSLVDIKSLANYNVSITGGKILSKNMETGYFRFVVTAASATIKLDNKALKLTNPLYSKKYTITNTSFKTTAGPTLSSKDVLKAEGNIAQTYSITVKGSKNYNPEDKFALISVDEATLSTAKNANDYRTLDYASYQIDSTLPVGVVKAGDDYKLELYFDNSTLKAGNYKLSIAFGIINDMGVFVPETKNTSYTLKVAKPRANKGRFSFTSSYKLNKDRKTGVYNTSVDIKYSATALKSITVEDLENSVFNANVNGKENYFKKYFKLTYNESTGVYSVILRGDLSDDEKAYILSRAGASDRKAYIVFETELGDDGYGNAYKNKSVLAININI